MKFLIVFLFMQWGADIRLTNDPNSSRLPINNQRAIFASKDTIHIVWEENRDGNYEIYYKRSFDGGNSWSQDIRLTNDPNLSMQPSISGFGSNIHLVWLDTRDGNWEIYYKNSSDGGNSWLIDKRLTNNPSYSYSPCISVSSSNIHVIWVDERDGNEEIYYKKSNDGGNTWSNDFRLTNNPNTSTNPSIWSDGSNIHVVWQDNRDGNWEIYYKRSNDGGNTWSNDFRLTSNPSSSLYPSIYGFSSNIHIVWVDDRDGNYEIYYKRSNDGGNTWSNDLRLTNNPQESFYPSIFVSRSNVHVTWTDSRDGNREIYYKNSIDGGNTWGQDIRLTNNSNVSQNSFLFASGTKVHLIWTDDRDGNWEIYYKKNPTGNDIEENEFNNGNFSFKKNIFWKNLNFENFLYIYDVEGKTFKIKNKQILKNLPSNIYFVEQKGKTFKLIKF